MSYITKHEIVYNDPDFGGSQRISAGVELTKEQVKALGQETIDKLVKSKALRDVAAEDAKRAERDEAKGRKKTEAKVEKNDGAGKTADKSKT